MERYYKKLINININITVKEAKMLMEMIQNPISNPEPEEEASFRKELFEDLHDMVYKK